MQERLQRTVLRPLRTCWCLLVSIGWGRRGEKSGSPVRVIRGVRVPSDVGGGKSNQGTPSAEVRPVAKPRRAARNVHDVGTREGSAVRNNHLVVFFSLYYKNALSPFV